MIAPINLAEWLNRAGNDSNKLSRQVAALKPTEGSDDEASTDRLDTDSGDDECCKRG